MTVRAAVARRRAGSALTALLLALGLPSGAWPDRLLESAREVLALPDLPSHAPTGADSLDGVRPALADAFTRAADAARSEGVRLHLWSAHRSRTEQERIWEYSVGLYGSEAAARRWVLPPGESRHVTGQAVDVGLREGAAWLERHEARFGLCRRYANEWWHFELTADQPGGRCALEPWAGWLATTGR